MEEQTIVEYKFFIGVTRIFTQYIVHKLITAKINKLFIIAFCMEKDFDVEKSFYKNLKDINRKKILKDEIRKRQEEIKNKGLTYYLLKEVSKFFPDKKLGNVLNLGGDLGIDLKILQDNEYKYNEMVSVDFYIPDEKIPNITYVESNIYNVSNVLNNRKFNLIILKEVIEHLFNPDLVLDSIKGMLSDNGILFITTPNKASFFNRILLMAGYMPLCDEVSTQIDVGKIKGYNNREGCNGHIRTFTYRSLIELVKFHGYTIKNAYTVAAEKRDDNKLYVYVERTITKIDKKLGSSIIIVLQK